MLPLLREAGIPIEPEVNDPNNTFVFEYPIEQSGRPASEVTIWEQAMNIVTLQREWADNAVSNTIYFKPKWILVEHHWNPEAVEQILADYDIDPQQIPSPAEIVIGNTKLVFGPGFADVKVYVYNEHHEEDQIELVLSSIMPHIKMISFLPHSDVGVYAQMPEEGISREEYYDRLGEIDKIDWSRFRGSDGEDEKFCQGDLCMLPQRGSPTG